MASVAFIGLGNMGGPMATNLIQAGHQVAVFDLVAAACAPLRDAGARVADSAGDAATEVDFVISMLPAGRHVESLYCGENGLLEGLDSRVTVLDCSTIDAPTARAVGAAARQRGIAFLDAPVSGGVKAAKAGTLSFMCGGEATTFERARTVLSGMGKNMFHAGPAGAGQVAKGCNNMLLAIQMIGTAEVLEMGVRNGLDPAVLSEIMLASTARNWPLEINNPYPGVIPGSPASNDYRPGFMVDLMVKDLGLAMALAEQAGVDNRMGQLAQQLYESHQQNGNGALDFSSIQRRLSD